jgi:dihydroorotase
MVSKENNLDKCGWSPLEGFEFPAYITHTFVNGNLVYACPDTGGENGAFNDFLKGRRLKFDR